MVGKSDDPKTLLPLTDWKWFDIANYPPSKDPKYWAVQIYNRTRLAEECDQYECDQYECDQYEGETVSLEELVDRFLNLFSEAGNHYLDELTTLDHYLSGPVESVKLMSPFMLNALSDDLDISSEWQEHRQKSRWDLQEQRDILLKPLIEFDEIESAMGIPLIIDPQIDDETIFKHLSEVLQKYRDQDSELFYRKSLSAKTLMDWYLYRILPIFDMNIVDRLLKQSTSRRVVALKVWNDGFGDAETIRKSSIGHMKKAFQYSTVNRLRSQFSEQDYSLT